MGINGTHSGISFTLFMAGKMIYPFICNTCHSEFTIEMSVEIYSKIGKKVVCPVCQSKWTKRTFYSNGFSVIYKDGGFTKFVKEENE